MATRVVRGGGRAPGAGNASPCARPTRWRVVMRCYGCAAVREYVVSAGRPLLDLSRGCPSCGGVRTVESIERAPALVLVDGGQL